MSLALRRLSVAELAAQSTVRVRDLLDPVLETMQVWRDRTEVVMAPWEPAFGVVDGRLALHDHPLHPHLEDRVLRMLLGVTVYKQDFWMDNPDLMADAMNRAPALAHADRVQYRLIDGQVVYLSNLDHDFGHHIDFFYPMVLGLEAAVGRTRGPVTFAGFLVDPVWTHLRVLFLPRHPSRTFQVGVYLDTNYCFSKYTRGRAVAAVFAHSLLWGSDLNLDERWSVRTARIQQSNAGTYHDLFARRVGKHLPKARERASRAAQSLSRLAKRKTPRAWRTGTITEIRYKYVTQSDMRQVTIDMDRRGIDNPVDFGFSLTARMLDYDLKRAIVGEREVADRVLALAKQ
jgi:hypothetical protein